MDTDQNKQDATDIPVPSLNTQVLAGVILAGVWLMRTNKRLRTVIENQHVIHQDLLQFAEFNARKMGELEGASVTVRDVVRLAAQHDTKGA